MKGMDELKVQTKVFCIIVNTCKFRSKRSCAACLGNILKIIKVGGEKNWITY